MSYSGDFSRGELKIIEKCLRMCHDNSLIEFMPNKNKHDVTLAKVAISRVQSLLKDQPQ